MAYMNQEKKAAIAAALKKVVPAGWKYSLRVRHHSTIIMTVTAAPVDFSDKVDWYEGKVRAEYDVNPYHYERNIICDEFRAQVKAIMDCLNLDNFNNSDTQSDYFHVGHYVELSFGAYGKPYVNTAAANTAAA
jgi:hypothetical protein